MEESFGERHGCGRDLRQLTPEKTSSLTNMAFLPDVTKMGGMPGMMGMPQNPYRTMAETDAEEIDDIESAAFESALF